MNSDTPREADLSPEEISTIIDWIDGNLAPKDAAAFEANLSGDPVLAQKVEDFAGLDALVRRAALASKGNPRARPRLLTWVALAAAAVLVFALVTTILGDRPPTCEVALVPSFSLAEDWIGQQPDLQGASAPGIGVSRGDNPRSLTAEEFLRVSELAESEIVSSALALERRQIEAGWFVVGIELRESATVVVLGFPQVAAASRLFPRPGAPDPLGGEAILDAGRHMLPSPRAVRGRAPDTLDYAPGFLVPIGAKEVTVLVAVRQISMGPAPLSAMDGWLADKESADQVTERLGEKGFRVERLLVREPQ